MGALSNHIQEQVKSMPGTKVLQRLLDGVGEAVVLTDPQFVVEYVNERGATSLGVERGDAVGSALPDLLPGSYGGELPDAGAGWSFERLGQGWAVYGRRLLNPGEPEQWLNRMVEAEQLAAVGQLASSVAHEIGAPLTAISVAVEYLLKHECGGCSFASRDLEVILSQTRRIAQLSKRLVDLARPGEPSFQPLDLNAVVREAVELVQRQLQRNQIGLSLELDRTLGPVRGDRDQLQQVLLNLVLNAQRALGGRAGSLDVRTRRRPRSIELIISDDGPGIPPEDVSRIFLPFFSRSGGTGLGLPLARQIVHAHGGTIEVDSKPGAGARFTIRLPAESHG